jgi:hypothetical protein
VNDLGFHNNTMTVTGVSTRSANLGGLLGYQKEFILPSFGVLPYDYFSSTLLTMVDHELEEETKRKYKEDAAVRVIPSSWIDYVAGCEESQHWNCGMATSVAHQGDLFRVAGELVLVLSLLLSIIVARVSYLPSRNESVQIVICPKKKTKCTTAIPPLSSTYHHPNHHHCPCRPKKQFLSSAFPKVPTRGYRRVLVPTPGTKCVERGYIIVHELEELKQSKPLPHKMPAN